MKKMLTIAALFMLFVISQEAKANHIAGSEISYECMPNQPAGTVKVRLIIYRDCGASSGSTATLCSNTCGGTCSTSVVIAGADSSCNGNVFGNLALGLVNVRDVNQNPQCPNTKNTCTNMGCVAPGTFTPAIERYEFEGIVNVNNLGIPSTCCNISFSYSYCCRSSTIKTGSNGQASYVEAVMNRCLSTTICNSSPTFSNDPYAVICSGQPFVFTNGAIDPDLDSLSYAFMPALQAAGQSVTYTSPYSYDAPMPWIGPKNGTFPAGIYCDPLTGDIMFTSPMGAGNGFIGVMAVEVVQWRKINGVVTLVGKTMRDIQMILKFCDPNSPPRFATRPSNSGNEPKKDWGVCVGEQLCFDIIGKDTDFNLPTIPDTTNISWNQALVHLGATFTPNYNPATRKINGPREDDYKFCWAPHDSLASNTPYFFTATVKDSHCPDAGTATRTFSILVTTKPDIASIQKTNLGCAGWQLNYTLPTDKPNQTFYSRTWVIAKEPNDINFTNGYNTFSNVQQTPVFNFNKTGKYFVRLDVAVSPYCVKSFYDSIIVSTVLISPKLIRPQPVHVCASADSVLLPLFAVNPPKGKGVWSYAQNPAAINNSKVIVAHLKNRPDTAVIGSWDNWIKFTYTDSSGCGIAVDSAIIRVYGMPPVQAKPVTWCENGGVKEILGTGINSDYLPHVITNLTQEEWSVVSGGGLSTDTQGLVKHFYFNPTDSGVLLPPAVNIFKYKYTHIYNNNHPHRLDCANEDTAAYRVMLLTQTIEAGSDIKVCKNETAFDISGRAGAVPATSQSYWYPANNTLKVAMSDLVVTNGWRKFNPSRSSIPAPAQGSTISYVFYFADKSTGCLVKDSIIIQIAAVPQVVNISGVTNITTDTTSFVYSVNSHSSYNYLWTVQNGNIIDRSDSNAVSVMWLNNGTGRVGVQITNTDNCVKSASLNVSINVDTTHIGLEQLQSIHSVALFPNPNKGNFVITLNAERSTELQLQLTDLLGRMLLQKQENVLSGANTIDVQLNFPKGVYLLYLKNEEGSVVKKVFVE